MQISKLIGSSPCDDGKLCELVILSKISHLDGKRTSQANGKRDSLIGSNGVGQRRIVVVIC